MTESKPPAYRVEDRSVLLPFYTRYIVEPVLAHIPATVSPNLITHLGHVLCFAGAAVLLLEWPTRGWPFAVSAALVWAYVFCDNADGAHARRTNQCSALGEFLDHGLDLLNVAYMGYVTAMAIGASPLVWVLAGVGIPAAAAFVYWEQAELGVFRLGLLNQIESSVALTTALLVSAIWGTDVYSKPIVLGLTGGQMVAIWTLSTVGFGIAHGIYRVGRVGLAKLAPAAALVAFNAALFASYWTGALTAIAVVVVGTLANVAFGLRMLSFRLQHQKPRADLLVCASAAALMIAVRSNIDARWALALTVAGGVVFTLQGALAARTSLRALRA